MLLTPMTDRSATSQPKGSVGGPDRWSAAAGLLAFAVAAAFGSFGVVLIVLAFVTPESGLVSRRAIVVSAVVLWVLAVVVALIGVGLRRRLALAAPALYASAFDPFLDAAGEQALEVGR